MSNLSIYQLNAEVPNDALKPIEGGRLKGFTDINAQWRIEKLTEMFGTVGIGWYIKIVGKHLEECENGEVAAFVDIELYYRDPDPESGEWSYPVFGTGGNMFVANEKSGVHVSDECYKMALTDAISVCCRQIGIGSNVYRYAKVGNSKYDKKDNVVKFATKGTANAFLQAPKKTEPTEPKKISPEQLKRLWALAGEAGKSDTDLHNHIFNNYEKTSVNDLTLEEYNKVCDTLKNLKKG